MGKKILVVVDVQYDFCNPNGALFVPGGEAVVNKVKDIITNFDYVIFTTDSHSLKHCSFKENGGIWPVHCVENSIGAGIPVELLSVAKDYIIASKGQNDEIEEYGAFSDNMRFFYEIRYCIDPDFEIAKPFRAYCDDVDELVVCGIAGDYCVVETLKNIVKWFKDTNRIKVYLDGVASIDDGTTIKDYMTNNNINTYKA